MKFITKKSEIVDSLQMGASIAERRQTIPILANLKIVAMDGKIEITATDLEIQIKSISEVKEVLEEGETTVSARKMSELCRTLPDKEELEFSLNNGQLTVSSKNFHADFATTSAFDFPELEFLEENSSLAIDARKLQRLLNKTIFCMASVDVRYYLNGLLVEYLDGEVNIVATDGHRMAVAKHPSKEAQGEECQICDGTGKVKEEIENIEQTEPKEEIILVDCRVCNGRGIRGKRHIIPRKAAIALEKILRDNNTEINLNFGASSLRIEDKNLDFATKLIVGKYPNYEASLPINKPSKLEVSKENLQSALSRVSVLSNETHKGVRIQLEKNSLKLTTSNKSRESAEEFLDANYLGEPIEISFNIAYLQDVLGAIETETVEISLYGEEKSTLIREPGNKTEAYVLAPMRL